MSSNSATRTLVQPARSISPLAAHVALFLALSSAAISAPAAAQCVSLTTSGSASTQSFDTLANTGTTNNLTITGWFLTETGGGARDNEQYAADTGGSNTGDTYSYGAAASTERALGGLQSGTLNPVVGACFTNNTGTTVTSLAIQYTGEQWRIANTAAARDDRMDFQYSTTATDLVTGTWIDVNSLDFVNPVKTAGTAGALDGNSAANRTALSGTVSSLTIANGASFWIRWTDSNASGADDGLAVDEFSLTPNGGPPVVNLSIADVTASEGNVATTSFTFTVSLSAPAGPGGVTFDLASADGTAQDDNPATEDNDYVANALSGQTIPTGSSTYNFTVLVNGDTAAEANETFFVNVTNVTGATVTDSQGQGTINNDDVTITPIHDVQGPGASSPIVGASVTVRGIVTGVRSNGFFVQEEEADYDADPATSEGILVFTSSAPPAAAAVGNLVQVTGTVVEFVPSQDALQPPLTEISSPTVLQLSAGNPLPAAVPLTATFPDPTGPHDQLERVEGMRVSVASLTVIGGTLGSIAEPSATASSTGVFHGVVTGHARPFREAGIQAPDPAPAGSIPPIPRFDSNPERLRVDSDSLVGAAVLNVGASAVVTGLIGPLDYTFRTYSINPDPSSPPGVGGGPAATPVAASTSREWTVAAYNLQRFFDTVDEPTTSEPVLTVGAFDQRLAKASLGVRDFLRMPDILAIVECENLTTLQALATRVSADAIAASQPDPEYLAFLVEGNDVGGIDVGFLVKSSEVAAGVPRVEVIAVTQQNAAELFTNPDTSTELLNDRPPLVLEAVVHHPNGNSFAVTAIVVHQRSLNGVADTGAGANGWATGGERVRAKRQKQAESLANLVQARQLGDPTERIVVLGDFNAFEVNDGFVDGMGVTQGTPAPDNQTAVPGDGIDLVNPDLDNLFDSPPPLERYSYVFDGNAQSLDHLLINAALAADTVTRRIEHPRINADFPEVARNSGATAVRLSDHDPIVGYFEVDGFGIADLSITKADGPDPVTAGTNLTYTLQVANAGPDVAETVAWTDTLPAGTTFVSLAAPGGWSCTTPAVGAGGTVACSIASLGVGNAAFSLVVHVDPAVGTGTVLSNTATATSTTSDVDTGDLAATATTTVATSADLSLTKGAAPNPVVAGTDLTYSVSLTNAGPSAAASASWSDTLPSGTTFVSLAAPGGWSCTTPAVGAGGVVNCSQASVAVSSAAFTLVVHVDPAVVPPAAIQNVAAATAATPDPDSSDNSASVTTPVAAVADLGVTKVGDAATATAGLDFGYTLSFTNAGPSVAAAVALSDSLPAGTTFVSLNAPGGWSCTTPPVGSGGLVQCTAATLPVGTVPFALTVHLGADFPGGGSLVNTATVSAASNDPNSANNSATATTPVAAPASVAATKVVSGDFAPGGTIVYTLVLSNAGPGDQPDNPGDELVDTLPSGLVLAGATASSGTATANLGLNQVTWNGGIPAGGSVTVTIQATIPEAVAHGVTFSNQGTVAYDGDGDGTNETTAPTDDPAAGGAGDPTEFQVLLGLVEIPTLEVTGAIFFALLLAGSAALRLRRREQAR